ncbi:hypothetical protein SAMD00019534_034580 [Acytostelium subglobosum LB1]|uniref:hypothetical protein n=1 Tax=Acytostelium subglobosum LB1 TaxID=1410327 RepID=UPI000644942C|nr:hypothetical protein SAMD00019534_034580 [Acytostelium subglobosum LB1]GAM20283.1 hypothetical protein SAMD00019534_034580 [Acytostelium subglobosum LB1]|eukprot:XP_012759804.1 hypothetical protein SAMD00019534_034580 [Acytostelium subglobosum LB1]
MITFSASSRLQVKVADTLWMYIDDRLVFDNGGLTGRSDLSAPLNPSTLYTMDYQSKSIQYSQNDEIKEESQLPDFKEDYPYKLFMFHCEQTRGDDSFSISIKDTKLSCPLYDYCGVCLGNGSTCCSPTSCTDEDPCTVDSCPLVVPGMDNHINTTNYLKYCVHVPLTPTFEPNTTCQHLYCQPDSKGNPVFIVNETCLPVSKCSIPFCDKELGCIYRTMSCPQPSDQCLQSYCDETTGQCQVRNSSPYPFGCQKGAIIGLALGLAALIALIGAGVALLFKTKSFTSVLKCDNPLYE